MSGQLKQLAEEMVQEIKSLKDLTKQELPEIAKEYVNYHVAFHLFASILSGALFPISTAAWYYGFTNGGRMLGEATMPGILMAFGCIFSIVSLVSLMINLIAYLDFKYQPRRKAIEAITGLFP